MSKISSVTKTGASEPFELQVARGQIQGHSVQNVFGYNVSVSTGDFVPVWELPQAYTYPTSALTMTITTNVTADVGNNVVITGLDSNYDVISEVVPVNLTATAASTIQQFFRINNVLYINGNANDGFIQVKNGGVVYAGVRPRNGVSQSAIFTVPRQHSFYLNRISAFSADSTSNKPAIFRNNTQNAATGVYVNVARSTFDGALDINRQYPFKYVEKTDIQFQLQSLSGVHEMSVFGEGVLVQEEIDQ